MHVSPLMSKGTGMNSIWYKHGQDRERAEKEGGGGEESVKAHIHVGAVLSIFMPIKRKGRRVATGDIVCVCRPHAMKLNFGHNTFFFFMFLDMQLIINFNKLCQSHRCRLNRRNLHLAPLSVWCNLSRIKVKLIDWKKNVCGWVVGPRSGDILSSFISGQVQSGLQTRWGQPISINSLSFVLSFDCVRTFEHGTHSFRRPFIIHPFFIPASCWSGRWYCSWKRPTWNDKTVDVPNDNQLLSINKRQVNP